MEAYSVMVFGCVPSSELTADARYGFVTIPAPRNATAAMEEANSRMNAKGLTRLMVDSYVSFALKYSPSTALTASGMDSSLRAFRSCSNAFTISTDMATIILFIAKLNTLPLYSDSNLYRLLAMYCYVWRLEYAI